MTIDINAPEVQEAIKAALEEHTAGLKAKNAELLGEVKKLRKNSEIDPAEYQSLKDALDEAQGKIGELTKQAKTAAGEAEKFRKQAEVESASMSRLLVENGLNEALGKAGVKPELLKAAKAMIASQVQLRQDGETRVPVVGDKVLSDFVGEWAKGDEGKHFVAAPQNGGGGAHGSNGGQAAKQINRQTFDGMNPSQKMEFAKSGGQVTD